METRRNSPDISTSTVGTEAAPHPRSEVRLAAPVAAPPPDPPVTPGAPSEPRSTSNIVP